jgi:hypothetical protein
MKIINPFTLEWSEPLSPFKVKVEDEEKKDEILTIPV